MEDLANKHCVPRRRDAPGLGATRIAELLAQVPSWERERESLVWRRSFESFSAAVALVHQLAPIADAEDHHPDVTISRYRNLELVFTTRSIGALSENDFIMAAKVDRLLATC
jgi:4a-hydroxytetrahydrobiopterin dehydratase